MTPLACLGFSVVASALAVCAVTLYSKLVTKVKKYPSIPAKGDPEQRIVLLDFAPTHGVVGSVSSFVTKVEAWLRFAGLDYEKKHGSKEDFDKAPKGKLPYIIHGGTMVPDSHFIIKYLANTYGKEVEATVAPPDAYSRAVALAVMDLVESHMYFGFIYFKWGLNWATAFVEMEHEFKTHYGMPSLLAKAIPLMIRHDVWGQAVCQGMARHAQDDVLLLMDQDLEAVSILLGDKPFLFGDRPYEVDASVFGILDIMLYHKGSAPELEGLVRKKYPNLVQYTDRIRATYFGAGYQASLVPKAASQKAVPASAAAAHAAKKDE